VYSVTNYVRSTQRVNKIKYRYVGSEDFVVGKQVLGNLLGHYFYFVETKFFNILSSKR
jgi:hypothetical protein